MSKSRSREEVMKRMEELMRPIDMQIMMCDNADDVLMLASAMMTTAKDIYVQQIGPKGAKELIDLMSDRIIEDGKKNDGISLG